MHKKMARFARAITTIFADYDVYKNANKVIDFHDGDSVHHHSTF